MGCHVACYVPRGTLWLVKNANVAADSDDTWPDRCHVSLCEWQVKADSALTGRLSQRLRKGAVTVR